MQPNIGRVGRTIRFVIGVLMLIGAAVTAAVILARDGTPWWGWLIPLVGAGIGVFAIFEARNGWCAFRALVRSSG